MEEEGSKKFGKRKTHKFLVFGLVFVTFLIGTVAWFSVNAATAPTLITYQGKVLVGGVAATTSLDMKFVLYNALSGGTPLYSLSGSTSSPTAVSTTPSGGLFSVDLGGTVYNALDPEIFKNYSSVYLEITIGSETLSPRKQIGASPYAFNAKYLDGVAASSTSPASEHIVKTDSSGNLDLNNVTSSLLSVVGNSYLSTTTISYLAVSAGSLSGVTGNISMWTNNVGYLTTSTGLTTANFATSSISQWTNDVGYITSTTAVDETDPIWNAASTSYANLSADNIFTGTSAFATTSVSQLTVSVLSTGNLYLPTTTATSGLIYIGGVPVINSFGTKNIFAGANSGGLVDWLGGYNTALGADSLSSLSYGDSNVAIGYKTLNLITNSSFNVAVGAQSLTANLAGGSNVGVGAQTLFSNTSGSYNTALGGVALHSNVSGGSNVAVGYDALWNNISGSNNTVVGYQAGRDMTGSGNLLFGYQAGYYETGSNKLYISNSSSTATNTLIYGDFTSSTLTVNGSLGINTTTPLEKMHINGGNILHTAAGNPTLEGSLDTPDNMVRDVYVSGKYAYMADNSAGLLIVDISVPSNPVLLGSYNTPNTTNGVQVSGKYAYLADGASGLQIIDISDSANPSFVGSYAGGMDAKDIYISGKYAYIADGNFGLRVIDVSNPTTPVLVGSYSAAGATWGIYVSGKYAYLADGASGLQIINISNPNVPTLSSAYDTIGTAYGVYVSGRYAYVGDGASGLEIIDISSSTNPILAGSYNTSGDAWGVYVSGNYAYIGDGSSGLQVINISSSTSPNLVGGYNTSGNPIGVYVSGKYAYIADFNVGLKIFDINGLETPSMYAGNIQSNDLTITENVDIWNNLSVRGGLNVGENGIMINGDFGMSGSVTNTLSFSTTTLFKTGVPATTVNAFIFDTVNSISSGAGNYLLSVRNAGVSKFSVATNGDMVAAGNLFAASITVSTGTNPGDLAEKVDVLPGENLEAGDVVMVDSDNVDTYRKTRVPYEQAVAGVISTNPTIVVGSGKTEYTAVMAMIGRVPVKVSGENGAIRRGDLLVSASIPGYAMKYDSNKDDGLKVVGVIGMALDNFSGTTGKIMSLVRTGWVNNRHESIAQLQRSIQDLASAQGISLNSNPVNLNVENSGGQLVYNGGNLDLQGSMILNVAGVVGKDNKWSIDSNGNFIVRIKTTTGEKEMYGMQSPTSEFVFSSSSQLVSGEIRITFEPEVQEIIDPNVILKINVTLTSGEASGIYVGEKSASGFVVKELNSGQSNATFDWMVVAKRRGGAVVVPPPVDPTPTSEPESTVTSTTEPTSTPESIDPIIVPESTSTPVVEPILTSELEPILAPVEEPTPPLELAPTPPTTEPTS